MGYAPDDPNVQVRVIAHPGLADGKPVDLDKLLADIKRDAEGLDGGVTSAVTEPVGDYDEDNVPTDDEPEGETGEERWLRQEGATADVLQEVYLEMKHALTKHGPMSSPHEGISVIREEFEELWDEIKADGGGWDSKARNEAIQIAATAVRYVLDLDPS